MSEVLTKTENTRTISLTFIILYNSSSVGGIGFFWLGDLPLEKIPLTIWFCRTPVVEKTRASKNSRQVHAKK